MIDSLVFLQRGCNTFGLTTGVLFQRGQSKSRKIILCATNLLFLYIYAIVETFKSKIRSSGSRDSLIKTMMTSKDVFLRLKNLPLFNCFSHFRRNTELTAESIKHLEKVFRENLAKDKDEFTLSEFKRIVPSKNVSRSLAV